jgi:hypothetical protein
VNVTVVAIDSGGSVRIGDGRFTLQDGTIPGINRPVYRLGACVDGSALALARMVAEKVS